MPATPTRELSVTYGSYTVSPDGGFSFSDTHDAFTFEFSFLVTGATEALFQAACDAAVTAYRKPFQDLTITQGAQTQSFKPSANTGLETRASIVKSSDHVANTGRSRRYTVRVTGGRPSDNTTTSGLREYGYTVQYAPNNRRLITISGVWTAVAGVAARAGYDAGIAAVCDATLTALGMTSAQVELVGVPRAESSYNDKTLTFSRDYKEIKHGQLGGGNDSAIVDQQLRITVRKWSERNAPGGLSSQASSPGSTSDGSGGSGSSGQALPFTEVTATYECWVRFDVTTDLDAKWTAIQSYIVAQMKLVAGKGAFAPTEYAPTFHKDDNRITATVRGIAIAAGTVRREWQQSVSNAYGQLYVPVWNGNPAAKIRYDGPSDVFITTRKSEDVAGGGTTGAAAAASSSSSASAAPSGDFGFGIIGGGIGSGLGDILGDAPPFVFPELNGSSSGFGLGGSGASAPSNDGVSAGDGASATDIVSKQTTSERFQYGLDTPVSITRTTTVTVQRVYTRVATAGFSGART